MKPGDLVQFRFSHLLYDGPGKGFHEFGMIVGSVPRSESILDPWGLVVVFFSSRGFLKCRISDLVNLN